MRRFWAVLGIIVLAGALIRVGYIVIHTRHDDREYDATYYALQARLLVEGKGYVDPFAVRDGRPAGPAADHAPLIVFALLPAALLDDPQARDLAMRFTVMVFGLAVIVATGALGRAVGGDRVGWVAASIAALSPNFWLNDGLIMADALGVLLAALALFLTYRARADASWGLLAALGAVCGLAALARAELVLLAPLLVLPLVLRRSPDRRTARAATGLAATLAVMAPWFVFNATRFERPVFISTNEGTALAGSNCDSVYYGELIGYHAIWCIPPYPPGDQSEQNEAFRERALRYMADHAERVPLVVTARVLRTWQVWDPFRHARYNVGEGRPVWPSYLGVLTMWVLFPLVVGGLVLARRRHVVVWPLLVPIVIVTVSAAATFGQYRFRAPAEPSIAVLAALAVVALVGRARTARRRDGAGPQSRTIEASSSS